MDKEICRIEHREEPLGHCAAKEPTERMLLVNRARIRAICGAAAVFVGAGLGNFAALADTAQSFEYDFAHGTSSGVLVSPKGASGMVNSGVGTRSFTWGTGVASASSSLSFTGRTFAGIVPEQAFALGTLSYFNGVVLAGTEAYSVDMRTSLAFAGLTKSFDFGFQLINTPNTASAIQNADSVLLSSSSTSLPTTTSFSVDGTDYTLKMGFGSVTGGGFSDLENFFVLEGQTASAELIGLLTAATPTPTVITPSSPGATPTVVPEPSTVVGGISAAGLILAFLVRRSRQGGYSRVLA